MTKRGHGHAAVKRIFIPLLVCELLALGVHAAALPVALRCEYRVNPLGIDATRPRLSWQVESDGTNLLQTAYQIVVAISSGTAAEGQGDVWNSGRIASSQSLVDYAGPALKAARRYYWSVKVWDTQGHVSRWAKPECWEMGLLEAGDWSGAQWIAGAVSPAAPLFRAAFDIAKPVAKARLYIGAAGYYVASLNGNRVGDAILDPGFTAYDKRLLYSTYDVTGSTLPGTNVLGVTLGRGFYAIDAIPGKILWWDHAPWLAKQPRLIAKLDITYADQTHTTVVSNPDWRTHPGPTTSDSLYRGETFDARLTPTGWDMPGYEAKDWVRAAAVPAPSTNLQAQMAEPIRVVNEIYAVSISQPKPGTFVYQFPVMMAGWPQLTVSGSPGTTVILRLGEKLNPDGTVDNMGDPGLTPGEIQRYEYTLAGHGTEVWDPQFSYAGFQYVQMDQFPGVPTTNSLVACQVHSDVRIIGSFSCSSALLNNVHDICKRSVLGNLHGVFTDSPMYEKRGWGDDGSLCAQAADNFGMLGFYEKWLNDIGDTQNAQGNIADIAPGLDEGNDPSWSSDFLVLPWRLYQEYGDSHVISTHYAAMKRYLEYLSSRATNHLLKGLYGDWVSPGFVQPPEGPDLVASANYYRDVLLFSKMATVLGYSTDAARYRDLAEEIKQAFNVRYLDRANAVYRTEREVGYRQTSNALPLDYGLVPGDLVALVTSNLVADVRQHNNHLNTGSFGTAALLPALSDHGQSELAYAIASQTNFPSWGWWLANGATTTWEKWVCDASLRSRNHAFLGSVDDWFYKYLAGIQPAEPGYKIINIHPCFPSGLTWVSAAMDTPQGLVSSRWKRVSNDQVELTVVIPPNAEADVTIPGKSSSLRFGSGSHTLSFTVSTQDFGFQQKHSN